MTAKKQAAELLINFRSVDGTDNLMYLIGFQTSKKCALIAINEQIKLIKSLDDRWHSCKENIMNPMFDIEIEYLESVKKEINNL